VFPGREWDTNFAGFYNDYDPRVRPWYIAATSGPKDVVVVLDCRLVKPCFRDIVSHVILYHSNIA